MIYMVIRRYTEGLFAFITYYVDRYFHIDKFRLGVVVVVLVNRSCLLNEVIIGKPFWHCICIFYNKSV